MGPKDPEDLIERLQECYQYWRERTLKFERFIRDGVGYAEAISRVEGDLKAKGIDRKSELEACPFKCKSRFLTITRTFFDAPYVVRCEIFGCIGPPGKTSEEAAARWNRRECEECKRKDKQMAAFKRGVEAGIEMRDEDMATIKRDLYSRIARLQEEGGRKDEEIEASRNCLNKVIKECKCGAGDPPFPIRHLIEAMQEETKTTPGEKTLDASPPPVL